MTNEEFIDSIYLKLLRREADQEGKNACLKALEAGDVNRDHIVASLVASDEFETVNENSEFVTHGHFFSAVTNQEERKNFKHVAAAAKRPPEINFNEKRQWELLNQFIPYFKSLPYPEFKTDQYLYNLHNPAFGYADGIWLHCLLRTFTPKRFIEVGCGYSSCMLIDTNREFLTPQAHLQFIEPYPQLFEKLVGEQINELDIIPQRLQDVPLDTFKQLEENDILFIDSSHVSKAGSDVNHALFKILPELKSGVIIHFHDIYWPFEYPNDWIEEGRCWNESYLLHAFLAHNDAYEILLYPNSLYDDHHDWFEKNIPLSLKVKGGSIWLKKR